MATAPQWGAAQCAASGSTGGDQSVAASRASSPRLEASRGPRFDVEGLRSTRWRTHAAIHGNAHGLDAGTSAMPAVPARPRRHWPTSSRRITARTSAVAWSPNARSFTIMPGVTSRPRASVPAAPAPSAQVPIPRFSRPFPSRCGRRNRRSRTEVLQARAQHGEWRASSLATDIQSRSTPRHAAKRRPHPSEVDGIEFDVRHCMDERGGPSSLPKPRRGRSRGAPARAARGAGHVDRFWRRRVRIDPEFAAREDSAARTCRDLFVRRCCIETGTGRGDRHFIEAARPCRQSPSTGIVNLSCASSLPRPSAAAAAARSIPARSRSRIRR